MQAKSYVVWRIYRDGRSPELIKEGLAHDDARAWCSHPELRSRQWAYRYYPEDVKPGE